MEAKIAAILLDHSGIYHVCYRGRGKEVLAACHDAECGFEGTAMEHISHVAGVIAKMVADA